MSEEVANTAFGKLFRRVAAPSLLRQFGEPVTYHNRGDEAGREVIALVERDVPEVIGGMGEVTSQSIVVRVKNDRNGGIASDEINTGGDEVSLPIREGQSSERRRIARVISDSGGMLRLLCN